MMDMNEYLKQKQNIVNLEIKKILEAEPRHPLTEIYAYCLANGKRFRPILVIAAAESCGIDGMKVMPTAIAIEMIHNFSLIHDDLPCMDNDQYRRGMLSCHAKFGETEALLAGDGLIIFAFELIAKNAKVEGIHPESVIKVVDLFSRSAGHKGMTGGQAMDMRFQKDKNISEKTLEFIHCHKTGALITASVMAGAILAEASPEKIERMKIYGENIGFTYQIIDDLLDMSNDKKTISFPAVFGVEKSRQIAEEATQKAIQSLDVFDEKAESLRFIARFLLNRKK